MHFVFYSHSLVSDWNHGNAHFLRGVVRELQRRGDSVAVYEPEDGWSRENLVAEQGREAVEAFAQQFPGMSSQTYGAEHDVAAAVEGADVIIVHEWTDPKIVAAVGEARKRGGDFTLLFHDTHHRAVSAETEIAGLPLDGYDGVLAFGETLRERYLQAGWGRNVFTWHEAADTELFHPMPEITPHADLVWIGNWGDDERSRELTEFLIEPAHDLGLSGTVHGVRFPAEALDALSKTGLEYRGWIANADVPRVFAQHRMTVHVPRRPYVEALPGIPTIRVFEALACGIPLVSAPWNDAENLFNPGRDFLQARDGTEMQRHLRDLLNDPDLAAGLARAGRETIEARHTCRHRVDELMTILGRLGRPVADETRNGGAKP